MARPLSPAEFLAALEKSKLLGPVALEPYRGALDRYSTGDDLADALTADGLLTKFQAEHLRGGKWQGFFLGTYKMLDRLGFGSTSVVYLAEHVRLKQRVAIKVLSPQKAKDTEALGRFEREAKAAAAVKHPHIVHAFDVATDGRLNYIVMEYVDGTTLLKKLGDNGRLAPRMAARLLQQVAQGLHAAHKAGIVHRDVKPSNVMIATDGKAKVMDLGLARYDADEMDLTLGKAVLGAIAYTAPEQMRENATVDARTDVYALGATFYLAVTGKRPPELGTTAPSTPARTQTEEVDYLKLMTVIERMMELRPEDRYQSMTEVVAAVSEMLSEQKVKAKAAQEVANAVPEPARLVSSSLAVDSIAATPTPKLEEEQFQWAVATEPTPEHNTPLPSRAQPLTEESPDEVSESPFHSFDNRVQGLFESLRQPEPTPDPEPEFEIELESQPLQTQLSTRLPARQWVVAAATFAIVLTMLFILAR